MITTGLFDTEYGKIKYKIDNNEISILEYSGRDLRVDIPEEIDGMIVTKICKKAFLSQKFITEIILPKSIILIEDYAFARCAKLNKVLIPYKKIAMGMDVFKDCTCLNYVCNIYDDGQENDIAFLLAKTLNGLDAFFLFDLENVGTTEWLSHLDSTISLRLEKDDMDGFSNMILCGEEEVVCGQDGTIEDSNPEHYKSNRVKEKVRLAFIRLLHDYQLEDDLKSKLVKYLLEHAKGCATEETWQVVLNEHGQEQEYYDYLIDIGGINEDNLQGILTDMGNKHADIKSYLIKYFNENKKDENMFIEFEL